MQPQRKRGKKMYMLGPGHMTKLAAMPIYGKTLNTIFNRITEPIVLKLGVCFLVYIFLKFIQKMILD